MKAVNDDIIKKTEALAGLRYDDYSKINYELNEMIEFFNQIDEIDTDDLEPMVNVFTVDGKMDEGITINNNNSVKKTSKPPCTEGDYYKVPRSI